MEKTEMKSKRLGLIGKNISYSFSRGYFKDKFTTLNLNEYSYENFDLESISDFKKLKDCTDIVGFNVTIPYKQEIIPFLDNLDPQAAQIGAVNTIKIKDGSYIGYNTDAYGFKISITPYLKPHHKKALILGTGGASKAIAFVLEELGIAYTYVSRNPKQNQLSYHKIDENVLKEYLVIINCSPVGTFPDVDKKPDLPYHHITDEHILFDLIYNPSETAFLSEGKKRGAAIQNGLAMLKGQAEESWEIWNR
ncbi:shikimate dehydrogenase family protein [Croceivirga radicis]|uniref:shikimate dehydrogenase family protein n=1 Tax=Croceivirga radicis TaxID=1929488 RepID=UPI000255B8DB|nr:shikimate dehydrogenase [Croceivirga radicis]